MVLSIALGLAVIGALFLSIEHGLITSDLWVVPQESEAEGEGARLGPEGAGPIATVPFGEAATGSGAQVGSVAEIAIIAEDGGPAAGAVILIAGGGRLLQRVQAGPDGVARIRAQSDSTDLVVAHRGSPLHIEEGELLPGRHTIRLRLGPAVSGVLLERGRFPDPPLALELRNEEIVPLPLRLRSLASELPTSHGAYGRLRLTCDSEGRFRFSGLELSWRGTLELPSRWKFAESLKRALFMESPASDLMLEVIRAPIICGRVVDTRGDPVSGASIRLGWEIDFRSSSMTHLTAGKDGRFSAQVYPGLSAVRVLLTTVGGAGRRELRIEGDLSAGRDLGDVRLSSFRIVKFVVRDVDGHPIAGACARAEDPENDRRAVGGPTNSAGHGEIELDSEQQIFRVAAVKFKTATASAPSAEDTLEIVLHRANGIRMTIDSRPGAVFRDLVFRVSAKRPLLAWREDGSADDVQLDAHGPGVFDLSTGTDGQRVHLTPDSKGRAFLSAVQAGLAIKVELADRWRTVLDQKEVILGSDEVCDVHLKVAHRAVALRASVIDTLGKPVAGGGVRIGNAQVTRTDPDGKFELSGIRSRFLDLRIGKKGFAAFINPAFPVPEEGTEAQIVMEAGRKATLEVVDPEGRPVVPVAVRAVVGRGIMIPSSREGHRAMFRDLPSKDRIFRVRIAGKWYEIRAPAGQEHVSLVVPPHGVLNVSIISPSGGWLMLQMSVSGGAAHSFTVVVTGAEGVARGKAVVPCGKLTLAGKLVRIQGRHEVVRELEPREVVVEAATASDVSWGNR